MSGRVAKPTSMGSGNRYLEATYISDVQREGRRNLRLYRIAVPWIRVCKTFRLILCETYVDDLQAFKAATL